MAKLALDLVVWVRGAQTLQAYAVDVLFLVGDQGLHGFLWIVQGWRDKQRAINQWKSVKNYPFVALEQLRFIVIDEIIH